MGPAVEGAGESVQLGDVAGGGGEAPPVERDLPSAGRAVTLVWVKRVWRCVEAECATSTWTETSEAIRARSGWTERARFEACRRVGEDGHSVAQVARAFGVGWATVMTAVRDYGTPLVEDTSRLVGVHAVGVDETAFLTANAKHSTIYVTGIVDLTRRRLLDIVPGRTSKALQAWASAQTQAWRDGIKVATFDPYRGYATALTLTLPKATRVLDAFHVTKVRHEALCGRMGVRDPHRLVVAAAGSKLRAA